METLLKSWRARQSRVREIEHKLQKFAGRDPYSLVGSGADEYWLLKETLPAAQEQMASAQQDYENYVEAKKAIVVDSLVSNGHPLPKKVRVTLMSTGTHKQVEAEVEQAIAEKPQEEGSASHLQKMINEVNNALDCSWKWGGDYEEKYRFLIGRKNKLQALLDEQDENKVKENSLNWNHPNLHATASDITHELIDQYSLTKSPVEPSNQPRSKAEKLVRGPFGYEMDISHLIPKPTVYDGKKAEILCMANRKVAV